MRIGNLPAELVETCPLWIVRLDIHCQLELRFGNPLRKIQVRLERKFLRKIWKLAVHFHRATPIPLSDRRELWRRRGRG